MSTIGQNIKHCRERQNLSQQELALKIRVGTKTVEKIESGEKIPDNQMILTISTVLDTPTSELLEPSCRANNYGIDLEMEQLIRDIGAINAKQILKKAKELNG